MTDLKTLREQIAKTAEPLAKASSSYAGGGDSSVKEQNDPAQQKTTETEVNTQSIAQASGDSAVGSKLASLRKIIEDRAAALKAAVEKVEGPLADEARALIERAFAEAVETEPNGGVSDVPQTVAAYRIGDRVRVTGKPHMEGQSIGTVAEVYGDVYGIVFDGMEEMGVHRWYAGFELASAQAEQVTPVHKAGPASAKLDEVKSLFKIDDSKLLDEYDLRWKISELVSALQQAAKLEEILGSTEKSEEKAPTAKADSWPRDMASAGYDSKRGVYKSDDPSWGHDPAS